MTDRLLLLGREGCELCEEMEHALRAHPRFAQVVLELADVDARPEWQRRYGLRIPVLLDAWNEVVCEARFDSDAFEQWCDERTR
jgi:hypothetical protein